MYLRYVSLFILSGLFLVCTGKSASAQKALQLNDPFSRYGIGTFRSGLNASIKGMGSISGAYFNQFSVNSDNPASYALLKLTVYEGGAEGNLNNYFSGNNTVPTGMATLAHLNIAVPFGKNYGILFGLKPVTRTYYNLVDSAMNDHLGPSVNIFSGDGTINEALLGFAAKYKNLSVGVNLSYLFGTTRHSTVLRKQYDSLNYYNTDFSNYMQVSSFHWKLGAIYQAQIKEKLKLNIGGTFEASQNMNINIDNYAMSWRRSNATTIYDTVDMSRDQKGSIRLPLRYQLGVHLTDGNQWRVGLDYTGAHWSQYRYLSAENPYVADRSDRIAIGAEFTANPVNLYKYLERITYRAGAFYGNDYLLINSNPLSYYGFSLGLSLPFKRSFDRIHLALESGRRGNVANNRIRESFVRFSVSVSLNDQWFIKRKYD